MTHVAMPVTGPWMGVLDNMPGPFLKPSAFTSVSNWWVRKGRVQTVPQWTAFPAPPDGNPLLGAKTFQDVLGYWHTLMLTKANAYLLAAGTPPTYTSIYAGMYPASQLPYSIEYYAKKAYFANGGLALQYADGSASIYTSGNVPGSCRFLAKNTSFLIMANTTEPVASDPTSQMYQQRVRWCKSGDPTDWINDYSAGLNDLVELEGDINGANTLGPYTFIYGPTSLVVMAPTGYGLAPFSFEDYSLGPKGVGVYYPYTLSTWGSLSAFIAQDDVYLFTGAMPFPIGGSIKKTLLADVESAPAAVFASFIGSLMQGAEYPSYWVFVPQSDSSTKAYVYSFDDKNWTIMSFSGTVDANLMSGIAIA